MIWRLNRTTSKLLQEKNIVLALGAVAPLAATFTGMLPVPGPRTEPSSHQYAVNLATPLTFETNVGQASGDARFLARSQGYHILLNDLGFDVRPGSSDKHRHTMDAFSVRFAGAVGGSRPLKLESTGGVSRYYGRTNPQDEPLTANHYTRVGMTGIYPGIDVVYYGTECHLEYDFVLAPHADPRQIALSVTGVDSAHLDAEGNLNIVKNARTFTQKKPVAFQEIAAGVRTAVDANYVLTLASNDAVSVALDLGVYDHSKPLIIDPMILSFSRLLGALGLDSAYGVATDSAGNIYVAGASSSANFPGAQAGPVGTDPYVSKIGASGQVIYTTFLQTDGSGGQANGIAVDAQGNAYVVGTSTHALPGTTAHGGTDAFAVKLGASGAVQYVTMLGGSGDDSGSAVTLDASGNAYVVGTTSSTDFRRCAKLAQPCGTFHGSTYLGGPSDGFVAKLGASGQVLYDSFLGGSGADGASAVALDATGNAWVAGYATSTLNNTDAFVSKVNISGIPDAGQFLGGSGNDYATGIGLDGSGMVYISGTTWSADFPIMSPFHATSHNGSDGFIAKFDPGTRALAYSSYLGGSGDNVVNAMVVDLQGNTYVAGKASSAGMLLLGGGYQQAHAGQTDAFLMRVGSSGTQDYASYLGGSGDDVIQGMALGNGRLTAVGTTTSANYPVTGTTQPISQSEAFVTQFVSQPVAPTALTTGASGVTQTGATLGGIVSAGGAPTSAQIYFGLTTAYAGFGSPTTVAQSPLAARAIGTSVSAAIAGLVCNTTYHFRLSASNAAGGPIDGGDRSFSTAACLPTSATAPATNVSQYGATLNGNVSANGAATAMSFEYGTSIGYGNNSTANPATLSANAGSTVSAAISGLSCNTTYHFRVIGANSSGTSRGGDQSFSTSGCPGTVAGAPTMISATPGPGRITVSFTAPVDNGGTPISSYTVTCTATGQTTRTANGTTSPIAVVGLQAGVNYACSVAANNGVGSSMSSQIAQAQPAKNNNLLQIIMLLLD